MCWILLSCRMTRIRELHWSSAASVSVENLETAFDIFSGFKQNVLFWVLGWSQMQYYWTGCQGKTRNKAFTNVCRPYLIFWLFKKCMPCLGYKICLTQNCPCRCEVFHGHRRNYCSRLNTTRWYVTCIKKLKLRKYPAIHTNYSWWNGTISN